ncbi:O-acyltransferase like protein-like isoform X2 [Toxorhynchites rutilus septentrionalis]|nr:O-acyltransferase like protein-like isoform X2 [Toxorhynchites rutilus septentrionalis]XP_055616431.1 O-acyltransferase like protein-like isoform X2 [Toxorhynchites rutilus septentrionalis]
MDTKSLRLGLAFVLVLLGLQPLLELVGVNGGPTSDAANVGWIELSEILKFPKLHVYDDFEDCRMAHPRNYAYCLVHAYITPDESSELWRNISTFNSDPTNYDHTKLEYGVCIQSLESVSQSVGNDPGKGSYAQLAHAYISGTIQAKYNLGINQHVDIYHCYTKESENPSVDLLEGSFYVFLLLVLIVTVSSTAYDVKELVRQKYPDDYFSQPRKTQLERLMAAFSVPRNIRQLKPSVEGKIRQDLQFLEAFRVVHMLRVILLHVGLGVMKMPTTSSAFGENFLHTSAGMFITAEFVTYVQTFLSISGMLMAVNFLEHIRKNPTFNRSIFWEKLRGRLYRILPAYAFVILMATSFLTRVMDGPIGQQFLGEAERNCRRWWWANLLFINNYIRTDQPCMVQSWYMAADMQLFIYGVLMMMMIWRWPSVKRYIFGAAFAAAVVIPTVITYVYDIEPAEMNSLKHAHNYNRENAYQYDSYFPFHQNIGAYSFGMLAGFIYHEYRHSPKAMLHSGVFSGLFRASAVLYFGCMTSVCWILVNRQSISPLLLAIYSTLFRQSWALLTTFLHLFFSLCTMQVLFKRFMSHPFIGVLGKLSYSFFLIHFIVILMVFGGLKSPATATNTVFVSFCGQVCFWTLLSGALLSVLIELPMAVALLELLESRSGGDNGQNKQGSVAEQPKG